VENPEWLAGDNKPGSTISHDFTIKNPGEADLFISAVIPGCGCTVAKFSSLVPPGGEGKVTLSIDLYEEWAGRDVNKSATILSNDPVNPQQRVVVRAKVMPKS
jgi:hypothetical protein